jgi:hypothetical protein
MSNSYVPPSPQDRKPKCNPKTIFDDDELLIGKCRAFQQLHPNREDSRVSDDCQSFLLPAHVAAIFTISRAKATEFARLAHICETGEHQADHIRNAEQFTRHHDVNEIPGVFNPCGAETEISSRGLNVHLPRMSRAFSGTWVSASFEISRYVPP